MNNLETSIINYINCYKYIKIAHDFNNRILAGPELILRFKICIILFSYVANYTHISPTSSAKTVFEIIIMNIAFCD